MMGSEEGVVVVLLLLDSEPEGSESSGAGSEGLLDVVPGCRSASSPPAPSGARDLGRAVARVEALVGAMTGDSVGARDIGDLIPKAETIGVPLFSLRHSRDSRWTGLRYPGKDACPI